MFINYCPTKVILGEAAIANLAEAVDSIGKRVILAVDPMLVKTESIQQITSSLNRNNVQTIMFDNTSGEVSSVAVDTLSALCSGSKAELIISIGGIQTLSIVKAASGFCGKEGLFSDQLYSTQKNEHAIPYIEIPSALRSPEMLSNTCWITDKKTKLAQFYTQENHYAHTAILDPLFIESLSPTFFYSGLMDLFLLSVEGYVSPYTNFYCNSLFLKTISFILTLQQKNEEEYRSQESILNALEAGFLYAAGRTHTKPGLGETLSRTLNSRYRIPKAIISSILLPHILEYLADKMPERIARMAAILDIPVNDLPDREAAQRVVENVRFHIGLEGIPNRLSEFNISRNEFKNIASIIIGLPHLKEQNVEEAAVQQLIENAY